MPRFYFHLMGRCQNLYDSVGIDCANLDEARTAATAIARALVNEAVADGSHPELDRYFEICGEEREVIDVVPFTSVTS